MSSDGDTFIEIEEELDDDEFSLLEHGDIKAVFDNMKMEQDFDLDVDDEEPIVDQGDLYEFHTEEELPELPNQGKLNRGTDLSPLEGLGIYGDENNKEVLAESSQDNLSDSSSESVENNVHTENSKNSEEPDLPPVFETTDSIVELEDLPQIQSISESEDIKRRDANDIEEKENSIELRDQSFPSESLEDQDNLSSGIPIRESDESVLLSPVNINIPTQTPELGSNADSPPAEESKILQEALEQSSESALDDNNTISTGSNEESSWSSSFQQDEPVEIGDYHLSINDDSDKQPRESVSPKPERLDNHIDSAIHSDYVDESFPLEALSEEETASEQIVEPTSINKAKKKSISSKSKERKKKEIEDNEVEKPSFISSVVGKWKTYKEEHKQEQELESSLGVDLSPKRTSRTINENDFIELLSPLSSSELSILRTEINSDETIFATIEREKSRMVVNHYLGIVLGVAMWALFVLLAGKTYFTHTLMDASFIPDIIKNNTSETVAGALSYSLGILIPVLAVFPIIYGARGLFSGFVNLARKNIVISDIVLGFAYLLLGFSILIACSGGAIFLGGIMLITFMLINWVARLMEVNT